MIRQFQHCYPVSSWTYVTEGWTYATVYANSLAYFELDTLKKKCRMKYVTSSSWAWGGYRLKLSKMFETANYQIDRGTISATFLVNGKATVIRGQLDIDLNLHTKHTFSAEQGEKETALPPDFTLEDRFNNDVKAGDKCRVKFVRSGVGVSFIDISGGRLIIHDVTRQWMISYCFSGVTGSISLGGGPLSPQESTAWLDIEVKHTAPNKLDGCSGIIAQTAGVGYTFVVRDKQGRDCIVIKLAELGLTDDSLDFLKYGYVKLHSKEEWEAISPNKNGPQQKPKKQKKDEKGK